MTQSVTTIGRDGNCGVVIDDPYVSRTHARISENQGYAVVEDLDSTSGTKVNGYLCRPSITLKNGDVLRFAEVEARFESTATGGPTSSLGPDTLQHPPVGEVGQSAGYVIDHQQAGTINQVNHDQINIWQQQQRESFAREIAATKTKARYLVWIGLGIWVVGTAIALFGWFRYENNIFSNADSGPSSTGIPSEFGRSFLVFAIGDVIAAAGIIIIIVGIVLHIVAASRRRQLLTMPSGSQGVPR